MDPDGNLKSIFFFAKIDFKQTREKSEILSVLQETLGSVGEDEENTSRR